MKGNLSQLSLVEPSSSSMRLGFEPLAGIQSEWTRLVDTCPEATMYQRTRWLRTLAQSYGFEFKAATMRDSGGQLAGAILFARGKNPFARKWTSLPCSDFSPPLARDDEARGLMISGIAESNLAARRMFEIRGFAAPQPWRTADCFAHWQLDLDRSMNVITRAMASNFRRQIHQGSEQSFRVESDHGLRGLKKFYRLMLETRRRLGMPPQPWRFFETLFEAFGPDGDLEVWTIAHGGKPVAAMVILRDGEDLHYKWSARLEPTPPGATHRLIAAVLERHAQRCRVMDLGRTDVRNKGLSRFKKELGAKPHPLPYSFLPRVPANVSPEMPGQSQQMLSRVWRRLPLPVTQVLGSLLYRYIV